MRSMSLKRSTVALAIHLGCTGNAFAAPENITEGELALTPPFCQDVQTIKYGDQYGNASPRSPYWVGLMGKTFWAMHHYCWGLIEVHRSRAAGLPQTVRDHLLSSAIGDYYYVIKNATPNFVMLPEIYLRIGEAQALKRDPIAALQSFAAARRIKRDYAPPYVRAAEVLEKIGRKNEAKALLAEGLGLMPDEPAVRSGFERLGGKIADVRPLAAASASASASAPASASASSPQ